MSDYSCFSIVNTYTGRDKEVSETACVRSEGIKIRCHGGKKGGDTRQNARVFSATCGRVKLVSNTACMHTSVCEKGMLGGEVAVRILQLVHSPPPARPFFSIIWGHSSDLRNSLYSLEARGENLLGYSINATEERSRGIFSRN